MSTTNTYQGMHSDVNSSRVLKPPGGGGSDIFGTGNNEQESHGHGKRTGNKEVANATKDGIFGAAYDPQRDYRRSDVKKQEEEMAKIKQREQLYQPVERAVRPNENTKSNLFGDAQRPTTQSGLANKRGGREFPAYDSAVYAAQINQRQHAVGRAQTHNPLTGEVYAGHEREVQAEEMSRPGRKKGACNSIGSFEEGAYNPITGEEYPSGNSQPVAPNNTENGEGDRYDRNASSNPQDNNPYPGSNAAPQQQRNSSRVLAPPGGKSTALW